MELKRTYALYGKAHSGKTSTLKKLIELLEKKADESFINDIDANDRWAIFKIKNKVIGVVTQGDTKGQVKKHLDKLEGKCHIIFCATRTKGGTCQHVGERFGEKLVWIEMARIESQKGSLPSSIGFYNVANSSMSDLLLKFAEQEIELLKQ